LVFLKPPQQPHPGTTSGFFGFLENHPTPPQKNLGWFSNHPTPPQKIWGGFQTTPPHPKKIWGGFKTTPPHPKKIEVVSKPPHLKGGVVGVIYNPDSSDQRLLMKLVETYQHE
jgi:hypothetical protein